MKVMGMMKKEMMTVMRRTKRTRRRKEEKEAKVVAVKPEEQKVTPSKNANSNDLVALYNPLNVSLIATMLSRKL